MKRYIESFKHFDNWGVSEHEAAMVENVLNIAKDEGFTIKHKFDSMYVPGNHSVKSRFLFVEIERNENSVNQLKEIMDVIIERIESILPSIGYDRKIRYKMSKDDSGYYQVFDEERGESVLTDIYGKHTMNFNQDLSDFYGATILFPIYVSEYYND